MLGHRRTADDWTVDTLNTVLLVLVAFATLYPFYYVLVLSFNEGIDATRGGIYLWPRAFSLENYRKVFSDGTWLNALFISVSRTLPGTALGVFFTSLVSYGLAQRELLLRRTYFTLLIISMYFSGGIIPKYILLKEIGLLNTFPVYVIPEMLSPFFVLIMIAFFREVPEALKESARIDGGSDFMIFTKIILPVSLPVIATTSLFIGVFQWNSWFDAAFFVQNPDLKTLSFKMMEIINKSAIVSSPQSAVYQTSAATTMSVQMATMIIAVAPILCVYPFLQKYFVKGIMLGSVKE